MFLLMIKTELSGGRTSLDYIGMFNTHAEAVAECRNEFFIDSGYGNIRMLEATGTRKVKCVWRTELFQTYRYLIAEF